MDYLYIFLDLRIDGVHDSLFRRVTVIKGNLNKKQINYKDSIGFVASNGHRA